MENCSNKTHSQNLINVLDENNIEFTIDLNFQKMNG